MAKYYYILVILLLAATPTQSQQVGKPEYTTSGKNIYVEIPYELTAGIPIIEVAINGNNYKFIVDTGAPYTHIVRRIIGESFLRLRDKTKSVGDAYGIRKEQPIAIINDMNIGGILFSTSNAAVSEDNSFIFRCLRVDGIIGGDFLKKYVVKFDNEAMLITLTSDATLLVNEQQKWDKMKLRSSKTYCQVKLEEKKSDYLLFDSGNGHSRILLDSSKYNAYQEKRFLEFVSTDTGYGSGFRGLHGQYVYNTLYRSIATTFNFGEHMLNNVPVQSSSVTSLGFVLANHGDIILDYPGKRYCFIPHRTDSKWEDIRSKVVCSTKDSKLVVTLIWSKELLELVNIGDRIVMIGSEWFKDMDSCFNTTLEALIDQHATTDYNTVLLEKPNGEQYILPIEVFL